MEAPDCERRVGSVVRGKWRLLSLLGAGGMAAVYLAEHRIGRREALKILHPEIAKNPVIRARFEQEARAANALRHPGAVEIRDVDVTDDGLPFLVMELVEGETLSRRLERTGPLSSREILALADELLDVLAAAHARGIVHRDIKPDNLLVQRDGRLKVLDFGIARVRLDVPGEFRTRSGAILGTSSYMSPEQVRGLEDIDGRSDLFSVGATLFRLASGRRVHDATHEGEMLLKMATEEAIPLRAVAPGASAGLCLVVDHALKIDRDRRYPDARTMQVDVRAAARGAAPPHASAAAAAEGAATTRDPPRGAQHEISATRPAATESIPVQPAWAVTPAHVEPTRDEPRTAPAPAPAPAATPDARAPRVGSSGLGRRIARVVLFVVGFASIVFGTLLVWAQTGLVAKGRGHTLGWFVGFTPCALGAAAMLFGFLLRDKTAELARVVLQFARSRGGRATVAEIAADTPLSMREATRALESLRQDGACRAVAAAEGHVVYHFDALIPRAGEPTTPAR